MNGKKLFLFCALNFCDAAGCSDSEDPDEPGFLKKINDGSIIDVSIIPGVSKVVDISKVPYVVKVPDSSKSPISKYSKIRQSKSEEGYLPKDIAEFENKCNDLKAIFIDLQQEMETLMPEDKRENFKEFLGLQMYVFNDTRDMGSKENKRRVDLEGIVIEQNKTIDELKGKVGKEGVSVTIRNICIATVCLVVAIAVYKYFIREQKRRTIQEEQAIAFDYVEALAARHRGEIYTPPKHIKPESEMTPEEKKARDKEIAKEKRRIARKKKQRRKARAKQRKFEKINESWDELLDQDFEMQYEAYKKNFEERKAQLEAQEKAAIEREKEAIEKEKREKEEAQKRAEEEAEKEKKQAEKLAIEEAESIEREKRRRNSWFGF